MSYIAKRTERAATSPLFFTFHGTGGDETQFHQFAEQLMPDARVVSPRGDVSEGGALRYFRRRAEGMYDMDDLAMRTQAMASFVADEKASAAQTLALGYSNGANIVASVAFAAPDSFDRMILMHPLIPFEPPRHISLKGKRILMTAGRRDPICPPDLTLGLEEYFRSVGADVRLLWHDGGHEIRSVEVDAIRSFLAEESVNAPKTEPLS